MKLMWRILTEPDNVWVKIVKKNTSKMTTSLMLAGWAARGNLVGFFLFASLSCMDSSGWSAMVLTSTYGPIIVSMVPTSSTLLTMMT